MIIVTGYAYKKRGQAAGSVARMLIRTFQDLTRTLHSTLVNKPLFLFNIPFVNILRFFASKR